VLLLPPADMNDQFVAAPLDGLDDRVQLHVDANVTCGAFAHRLQGPRREGH
jgi:hypothetical protein